MSSSSGNSTSSESIQIHCGSEDNGLVDLRKRKRMQSNRESARRSRMRKQKHLDDLVAQANQIMNEKEQLSVTIDVTTRRFAEIEAENSVLRAQVSELSNRLDSINEILKVMNSDTNCTSNQCIGTTTSGNGGLFEFDYYMENNNYNSNDNNPWNMNMMFGNQQGIMASAADMFGY